MGRILKTECYTSVSKNFFWMKWKKYLTWCKSASKHNIDNTKYACNHNFKYHSWHCALIGLQLLSEQLKYINFISKLCFHCRYVYASSKGSILLGVLKPTYGFYGWVEVILPSSVSFRFVGAWLPINF